MAHGYLQSFDSELEVYSAGTHPAGSVSRNAVKVMMEDGIDISDHKPGNVDFYLKDEWDYVITVCDSANETCPVFAGNVKNRLHMGFEDPSHASGSDEFIMSEFRRIRDQIKNEFYTFYKNSCTGQ